MLPYERGSIIMIITGLLLIYVMSSTHLIAYADWCVPKISSQDARACKVTFSKELESKKPGPRSEYQALFHTQVTNLTVKGFIKIGL